MASNPTRIAILFSGTGTNLKNLVAHILAENVAATLELAICNRPDAKGLEFCRDNNIPHELIDHTNYSDRAEFDAAMQTALQAANIDLICAAGFMRLLTPEFVRHWQDRIINIHPSLLPAYKGLHTHRRVLEAGDKTHGCTVHMMRPEMDEGPILVQRQIDVLPDDTEDTLAARVMEQELIAYPEALDMMLARLQG
ncbi:MAG: phosphoribosylglycinamide formyltransferase [PS1 clade bacterium]|uniref:Phosphoribosylglycinamide formyltransferase n=1 Tax=PS1 clade bacterium TaxID=2175152 RepID=A0A368E2W2_9PROT|nr:MAG: phosphoribosylglycinamide formyltransferase [PS1 clade bacterium]HCV48792.1 phosphoribosylglycinamide formyltransferase [Rhodobiaceae bacterium]|tara:strand:+ start:678 stop:1265 length:588 start_codon:yes stop_codon:yes gene_type:complete